MRYMVMTTKHHEGFCHFDTKTTDYCSPKQGPGRDLVREYVDAARAEGMRVGFYYSLMDWHHPDGARCATDDAARKRFVEYIHTHIRELLTNYGKIDVLWYDVSWPLDAPGWESERMNKMVFELQPDIIVNNRNKLPGDFSTPEQQITADKEGRAWESCMTLNDSWGYQRADDDWKSPRRVIQNLIDASQRQHALHARALLARRLCGSGGFTGAGEVSAVFCFRRKNHLPTGQVPCAPHRPADRSAGPSGYHHRPGMRRGAHPGQHFCSPGKTSRWSLRLAGKGTMFRNSVES